VFQAPFLQDTFLLAKNRAPTKLNEVTPYHLYTPQKINSIIIVRRKPVSQAAGKTTSAPSHAALKALRSAYGRNGFNNASREKYVVGQHFQLSILHPHIFHNN